MVRMRVTVPKDIVKPVPAHNWTAIGPIRGRIDINVGGATSSSPHAGSRASFLTTVS